MNSSYTLEWFLRRNGQILRRYSLLAKAADELHDLITNGKHRECGSATSVKATYG